MIGPGRRHRAGRSRQARRGIVKQSGIESGAFVEASCNQDIDGIYEGCSMTSALGAENNQGLRGRRAEERANDEH